MNGNFTSTLEVSAISADLLCKEPFYNIPSGIISIGEFFIKASQTDTECIRALESPEPELVPYECCRASGALSFWDNESEDIYTFEDGQPL